MGTPAVRAEPRCADRRVRPTDGGARAARSPGTAGGTVALATLAALALAACGGGPGPESAARPSDAAVTGTVVTVSDVSDLPDVPDPDGWVVAIPAGRIPEVMELAGDDPTESELRYSWFAMSVETVEGLGGTVGEVDRAGRFRLAASGDLLVCRLVRDRWTEVVSARGCARSVLPGDGVVQVTNGEAGLHVVPDTERRR